MHPARWHAVRELRGGFVLRPGVIAMALAATAVGLAAAEQRITTVKAWSDLLDRVFPPEPEAAHVVLGTIAGSMITVVSVVYSILLVALTFTSAQFSPAGPGRLRRGPGQPDDPRHLRRHASPIAC